MSQCGKKDSCAGCDTPGSKCGFVKSSAFAPVSLNLMGMYLVKEHMNAHYRRLCSVKAAVDTKAPHSLQTKQKFGGGMKSTSRTSSRTGFAKPVISQSILKASPEKNMNLADKIDRYLESVEKEYPRVPEGIHEKSVRPSSSTSRELRRIKASQKTQYSSSKHSRRYHASSDLLERHKDYFTKPTEPFVPRTLIRQGKSRLIGSRLYHPPVYRSSSQNSLNHQQLDHSDLLINSRTRQLALASGRANKMVPALNIQRDSDHVRWLEEQARKVKAEQKLDELEQMLDYDDDYFDMDEEPDQSDRGDLYWNRSSQHYNRHHHYSHPQVRFEHPDRNAGITIIKESSQNRSTASLMNSIRHQSSKCNKYEQQKLDQDSSQFSEVRKQLEAKEEELKYLEFIRDVTNEILLHGIYTDQGLKQIFFYHMNERNDLSRTKMKKLLEKLQEELGISKSDSYSWLDMVEDDFDGQYVKIEGNGHPRANSPIEIKKSAKLLRDENSNSSYEENRMGDQNINENLQAVAVLPERAKNISSFNNTITRNHRTEELAVPHNSMQKVSTKELDDGHHRSLEFNWETRGNKAFSPEEKHVISNNSRASFYDDEPEKDVNSTIKDEIIPESHFVLQDDEDKVESLQQDVDSSGENLSEHSENFSGKSYSDDGVLMLSDDSKGIADSGRDVSRMKSLGEVRNLDESIAELSDDSDKVENLSNMSSEKSSGEQVGKNVKEIQNDNTDSIIDMLEANNSEMTNETESIVSEDIGKSYMDDFEQSDDDDNDL